MYPPISKQGPYRPPLAPNMADYERERRDFDWSRERARLSGAATDAINIGVEALDRQVQRGLGGRLAVRFLGREDAREDYSYAALLGAANRCANALSQLGVQRGERVFSLLGRGPALHTVALGTLRSGSGVLPVVLGLRSRARTHAPAARRRAGAGDDRRCCTSARWRRYAPACRNSGTC